MNSIVTIGIGVNKILGAQMKQVFDGSRVCYSEKKEFIQSIRALKYALLVKQKNVLIYNCSALNILIAVILKIRQKNILYHLHDPVPHSGFLNPVIIMINYILTFLANEILVFSSRLKQQVAKHYPNQKIHILTHGANFFKYTKSLKNNKITIGFFLALD